MGKKNAEVQNAVEQNAEVKSADTGYADEKLAEVKGADENDVPKGKGKGKGKGKKRDREAGEVSGQPGAASPGGKISDKAYAREMKKLHVELVKLQQWVLHKGLKVCIVFEGRDGAGKGGTIKAITERVSPRVFRVIALPAPT